MSTTNCNPRYFSAFFTANFDRCTVENIDRYKDGVLVLIEGRLIDSCSVLVKQMQILLEPLDFTRTHGNDVPDWSRFSKDSIFHHIKEKITKKIYFTDKAKFESRAVYYENFLSSCPVTRIDQFIRGSLLDELRIDVYENIKNDDRKKFCIEDYCLCCQN